MTTNHLPQSLDENFSVALVDLFESAISLASAFAQRQNERSKFVVSRLRRSVLRPLAITLGRSIDSSTDTSVPGAATESLDPILEDQLWDLTLKATSLRSTSPATSGLLEATAALQSLTVDAKREDASSRLEELEALQTEVPSYIKTAKNGPYLVSNPAHIRNWLGEDVDSYPQMALCRCGKSSMKPYCDGTHAEVGFTDDKDPKRVPDQRDTYEGQQVTIYDNRGICAHSGFCTDRLSSVFRLKEEPFVSPSGGRMDEIIHAVRNCPSGALSFGLDGVEARAQADSVRPANIEVSKDGPYRVTGHVPLVNEDDNDEPRAAGSSREHYSLCRCGHSQNKPFCSGMHWYVDFHDPMPDEDHEPSLFEWAGGFPALLRTTEIFYGKYVPQDPLIGPLFAHMSPDHPERVAAWLSEVFGGPSYYTEQYGDYNHMISQHLGKSLTEEQRARWVSLIVQSSNDAGLPNDAEFRAAFNGYLEWGSRLAVENSQSNAKPPANMPVPKWWWVCNSTPAARVSALAEPIDADDAPITLPEASEPVSFERHIKSLFRKRDRDSMKFAFDLWSIEEVTRHADAIAERLRAGTMPCDGAWPVEHVEVFERWISDGCLE